MQTKEELRKFAKKIRQSLDMKEISDKILRIFLASSFYEKAQNIAIYYPYGTELNLLGLVNDASRKWYLPKITTDINLTFHSYRCGDELEKDKFGILEPITTQISPDVLDMMIIPALACDKCGYRLGYGKGYYDRYLSRYEGSTVGICYEENITEELFHGKYDRAVDLVLTEKHITVIEKEA